MRRLLQALLLTLAVFCPLVALSQVNTTVSATITDGDGTAWANGTWKANFIYPANLGRPTQNGTFFTMAFSGSLDGTGTFSQAVASTTGILPLPPSSGWQFTVCPQNNIGNCAVSTPQTITGTTQSLTALLSSLTQVPRPGVSAFTQAYNDTEIANPVNGMSYYNLTINVFRDYTSGAWVTRASGGGPPTGAAGGDLSGTYPNPNAIALTPIESHTASGSASLSFTTAFSTPCTVYDIEIAGLVPSGAALIGVTFNSDTTADYANLGWSQVTNTLAGIYNHFTGIILSTVTRTLNATSSYSASILLTNASSTTLNKNYIVSVGGNRGADTTYEALGYGGVWENTAAITSVQVKDINAVATLTSGTASISCRR